MPQSVDITHYLADSGSNLKYKPYAGIEDRILAVQADGTVIPSYKTSQLALIVDLGLTAYVSTSGDNTTGLRGRIDRPFKTIQAAVDAPNGGTGKPNTVIVRDGDFTEAVTITKDTIVILSNVKLTAPSGSSAIVYNSTGIGIKLVLDNSTISSDHAEYTVYSAYNVPGYIIGTGSSLIRNTNVTTGRAVKTIQTYLAGFEATNTGSASYPCIEAQDCWGERLRITSTSGYALKHNSPNMARGEFRNSWFKSTAQAGVFGDGLVRLINSHVLSVDGPAFQGTTSRTQLEAWATTFYSTNAAAMDMSGGFNAAGISVNDCILRGGTDCVIGANFYIQTANMHLEFNNCKFFAGTGNLFGFTYNINSQATGRVLVRNSLFNKDFAHANADKFVLSNNVTIVGMAQNFVAQS